MDINVEEELAILRKKIETQEAQINGIEAIVKKNLNLIQQQNGIVQKLAEAVASILKKMVSDVKE